MRKISKCFLLLVTLVSLVCVFFYKQQYDRLYNVLQVLEFFGNRQGIDSSADPFKRSSCPQFPGSIGSPVFRPPSWQRISGQPDIFIYSAFCARSFDSNNNCPLVKIVALAPNNFDRTSISCQLWYEDTLRPVFAMFTAEMLKTEEEDHGESRPQEEVIGVKKPSSGEPQTKLSPFLFTCESKFSSLLPYGISLTIGDKKEESFTHIEPTFHENETPGREPEINVAACIRPQASRVDSGAQVLENILLHRIFGITEFNVYDAGLTTNFIETLAKVEDLATTVKILPWNLPSGIIGESTKRILVQTDCYLRTTGQTSSTVVLEPQQILIPDSGSILDVLKKPGIEGKLEVEVLKFCSEFESSSSTSSKLVALQQNKFSSKLSSQSPKFVMTYKLGSDSNVVQVPKSLMSVHDYGPCGFEVLSPEESDVISDSTFFKLWATIDAKIGRYFDSKKLP